MKKILMVFGALVLASVFSMAEEFGSEVIFKSDVRFDRGSIIKIDGTKLTATAAELNAAGADQTALITETNRAQVAEAALSTRIVTETNRAIQAEALLATSAALVSETNRARVAEAVLSTNAVDVSRITAGLATTTPTLGLAAGSKIITTPNSAFVTNGQPVTLSGVLTVLTGIGSAENDTNTITLVNPTSAGQWAILHCATASTNLVGIAKTGNFVGPAIELAPGESAYIFAPGASSWAGIGQ